MSDETTPATAATATPPPLDEVMLAMDVVDVLRHQEALVRAELDDDARRRAFVERVQAVYASQGIEVPSSVIERGVEALEQDRFRYRPRERTFAVRAAEVYVDRGRWARRALVVLAAGALVWGGIAWAGHRRDRALVDRFSARSAEVDRAVLDAGADVRALEQRIARAREGAPASGVVADLLHEAEAGLEAARKRLAEAPATDDPRRYPRQQGAMDAGLEVRRRALGGATAELSRAGGHVDAVERLRSLRTDIARILARLAGVAPSEGDRAAVDRLKAQAEAAVDAGDEAGAKERVAALGTLVGRLVAAVEARRGIEARIASALASVEGVALDAGARGEVDALATRARSALAAGDTDAAGGHASQLSLVVGRLARSVETRRAVEAGLAAALAALEGVPVEPDARREVDALVARARAALAAGDPDGAKGPQVELVELARELGLAYELRIVSRPEERSGVWRYPEGRPDVRNYYVIVEPVGPDGRAVEILVHDEETGASTRTRRFGVRVPEDVFEKVKADKQDNGIVDRNVFAVKRRGAREPEYRFAVAGGRITTW